MKNWKAFAATMVVAGGLLAPFSAFAVKEYGQAGCGLGAIVIGDSPGIIQVFGATTNGLFGSQTFGITSGTSKCEEGGGGGMHKASLMQETFVSLNQTNLSADVAKGGGEYLQAFSVLVGCDAANQAEFYSVAQKNHDRIFANGAEAATVVTNFKSVIAENAKLGAVCKL
jgi:hypothetical protein